MKTEANGSDAGETKPAVLGHAPWLKGRLAFTVCKIAGKAIEKEKIAGACAARALPNLGSLKPDETHASGWAGFRHALDVPILKVNSLLTCCGDGVVLLQWVEAERKIPAAALKAAVQRHEVLRMEQERRPFLDKQSRAEIKAQVIHELLPSAVWVPRSTPILVDCNRKLAWVGATSVAKMDAIGVAFLAATGLTLVPYSIETATARTKNDCRDWRPAVFGERPDSLLPDPAGEFMTWLWCASDVGKADRVAIDGPLTFRAQTDDGLRESSVRKARAVASPEAFAALRDNKRLVRAKVLMRVVAPVPAAFTFDADTFSFRGLELPIEKADLRGMPPAEVMATRVLALAEFTAAFMELVDRFVEQRAGGGWKAALGAIRDWIDLGPRAKGKAKAA